MSCITLDKLIYYLLLVYALSSSISIAMANIAISLASLVAIARVLKEPLQISLDKNILKVIGIFFVVGCISSLVSPSPIEGLKTLWGYFYRMFPLVLSALFLRSREQLYTIILTMALSIGITAIYGVWQGVHGVRALAFTSNAMILAGYLTLMIPLLFVTALEYPNINEKVRLFLLGILVIAILAMLFNLTRGAWLAIAIFFAFYIFLGMKKNKKAIIPLLLFTIMCSMLVIGNPSFNDRVRSITDFTTNQSNAERLLLWESSWRIFKDYPLLGIGPGNFKKIYNEQYISPESKVPNLGHAHNNFLHILAEQGILGCLAFCVMFIYFLYSGFNNYRKGFVLFKIFFFCTITLLIQGLTEFNFGDSAVIRMYWFILGIAQAEAYSLNPGTVK